MLYDKRWEKPEVKANVEPWQKVLLDAADLLETEGWSQGSYCNPSGQHCLVGAIRVASGLRAAPVGCRDNELPLLNKARNMLRRHLLCADLETWNDMDCCSKQEVILALREAAVS